MISVRTKWLLLWSMWPALFMCQQTSIRYLSDGSQVRGTIFRDGSQRYYGIPYASSGQKYRFQAPGPAPKWDGIFEATKTDTMCTQLGNTLVGTEDCLVLNVYSPSHAWDDAPLPVIVFIHGGGFQLGSHGAPTLGPNFLLAHDVILVTINYRLSVNGFLCLGTKDEAPGNAGLKDQVAALKWVQRNIRAFGGDPDNVTIFGGSAVAASVSYQLLSPMSKRLFHKAIIMAGSSTALWALQKDPLGIATALAESIGFNYTDAHDLYRLFMKTPLNDLVSAELPAKKGLPNFITTMPYVPCVEQSIDGVEPFITDTPYNILTKGDYNKVPVIIGLNDQEGYVFSDIESEKSLSNLSFEAVLENFNLDFPSEEERRTSAQLLQRLYMGNDEISRKNIVRLSKFYGEPYFDLPAIIETELLVNTSGQPVYSYLFQYSGLRNLAKLTLSSAFRNAPGATHGDEGAYILNIGSLPTIFETKMVNRMTTWLTNFAKYGTPTPEGSELLWPAATVSAQNRLEITAEPYITPVVQHPATLQYWLYLFDKYLFDS